MSQAPSFDARAGMDRFTAATFGISFGLLMAGVLPGLTAGAAAGRLLFWAGLALLGTTGLLYGARWFFAPLKPLRSRPFPGPAPACLAIIAGPQLLACDSALRGAGMALALGSGVLSYFAFREAFSARSRGLCSCRGMGVMIGAICVAGVAAAATGRCLLDAGLGVALSPGLARSNAPGFEQAFGFFLLAGFPFLAAAGEAEESRPARLGWRLAAGAAMAGILLSLSRAAWLGLGAALAAMWVQDRRQWKACLACAALALIGLILEPSLAQRAATLLSDTHATNVQRLDQWRVAAELAAASPLTGWGLGSFGGLYCKITGTAIPYPWPHNLYLHLAAECGLPALIAFGAWLLQMPSSIKPRLLPDPEGQAMAEAFFRAARSLMAGVLVFGLFDL